MTVYVGPYLTITHEKSQNRLVQFWTKSPENIPLFKNEMLRYIHFFCQIKPQQVLWIQENMTIFIDNDCKEWIEENINIPALELQCLNFNENGEIAVAFVLGKNIISHIEVVEVFEGNFKSCMIPKHFSTEAKAREWLNKTTSQKSTQNTIEIKYKGVQESGVMTFEFHAAPNELSRLLKTIKKAIHSDNFVNANREKYDSLSKRELEILRLYSTGKKHQKIAEDLHISVHTVRTHWRNIKKKLDANSSQAALRFIQYFHPENT